MAVSLKYGINLEAETYKVNKALLLLPKDVRNKILKRAGNAAANVIFNIAKVNIESTYKRHTGRLLGKNALIKKIGEIRGDTVTLYVANAKRTFYLKFLERGTKNITARPVMRPAMDAGKGEAFNKFKIVSARGVRREVKKYT